MIVNEEAVKKILEEVKPAKLVAATKYVDVKEIEKLEKLGVACFGENRVQAFLEKYENYHGNGEFQFIGTLQPNKVKYIIDKVTLIHAVDRYSLLKEIEKIDKIKWIRILYSYPETITDELIKTVKESSKICHYFDIPIQHISDSVLKRMNRKSNGESIRKLIIKLRKEIPDVIIRTTVMVGFPGETQEDFEELYEFLKEAKFDKLGAFTYSKEEGTAAEKMPNQVHPSTKRNRYNKVMKLQQEISKKNLENKIETIQKVRIEGMTNNKKYYVGRSYMDVPEIDGLIYIENTKALNLGEWINCKIIGIKEYDMIGKIN